MEEKSIGRFIAVLRKANGMTQKQLAEKLNVSDKAVSRWERDETAPDISLIPVIADLFGITCDELLCGERKLKNDSFSGDEDALSAKGEKQRRRIISVSLSEFKNRSIFSCSIAFVGLIVAMICNFAFSRAVIGFFIAVIFYLVAAVCHAIFVNKAFLSVADDDFSQTEIKQFKSSVIKIAEYIAALVSFLFAVSLPLVANPINFDMDAYIGILPVTWLAYGALYGVVILIICFVVCRIINLTLTKRGLLAPKVNSRAEHNLILLLICTVVLSIVVASTFGIYCAITDDGYWPKFADGTVFEDYESFAEFMEKDVSIAETNLNSDNANSHISEEVDLDYDDDDGYVDPAPNTDEYYNMYISDYFEDSPYGIYDDYVRIVIKDADGKTVVDCIRKNETVVNIEYGDLENGFLPIKVVTSDESAVGQQRLMHIKTAFIAVYVIETVIAIFVYIKKRQKVGDKNTNFGY